MTPTPKPQTTRPAIIGPRLWVAAVDMTPPTRKMKQPMKRPHLRPVRATMGAAPSAPKKAPTWRSETTFELLSAMTLGLALA
jgi:hypothetical protein